MMFVIIGERSLLLFLMRRGGMSYMSCVLSVLSFLMMFLMSEMVAVLRWKGGMNVVCGFVCVFGVDEL